MDDKAVDRLYLAVLKDVGSGKQVGADRQRWEALLGPVAAFDGALVGMRTVEEGEGITVERFGLETDEVTIPVVIVRREEATRITIALSGAGKAGVIQERAAEVESMLGDGAVCLVDVRGIGELEPEEPRTFRSRCAARVATALMLGESILGMQVRDLRTVIAHLRSIGYEEIVVTGWVEEGRGEVEVGGGRDDPEEEAVVGRQYVEPVGGILAELAGVFEDVEVRVDRDASGEVKSLLDRHVVDWPADTRM